MPVLPPSIQFTRREVGYMAWHEGIRPTMPGITGTDLIYKAVGVIDQESDRISGNYRPKSENTAAGADADVSMCMWNLALSRAKLMHDPYELFHPLTALGAMCDQMRDEPLTPFRRWSLGPGFPNPKKTDITIKLAEVKAEIGSPERIYDIDRSPYWRMMWAGMDVRDLPVPPANVYVSRVPPAPLKYGQAYQGGTTDPTAVNSLQKWLAENRLFIGGFDNYYGPRVQAGVAKVQLLLQRLGLWTGPVDGKQWSVELKALIDDLVEFDFLTLWS